MTARDVVAEVKDTLIGWLIGSGYYAMTVGVDEAREMAEALDAAGLLVTPVPPGEVPALAEIEAAYCETSGTDDERRRLRVEFRAWLAEHDAQVAARALREAAEAIDDDSFEVIGAPREFHQGMQSAVDRLRRRADRIGRQEEGR